MSFKKTPIDLLSIFHWYISPFPRPKPPKPKNSDIPKPKKKRKTQFEILPVTKIVYTRIFVGRGTFSWWSLFCSLPSAEMLRFHPLAPLMHLPFTHTHIHDILDSSNLNLYVHTHIHTHNNYIPKETLTVSRIAT